MIQPYCTHVIHKAVISVNMPFGKTEDFIVYNVVKQWLESFFLKALGTSYWKNHGFVKFVPLIFYLN